MLELVEGGDLLDYITTREGLSEDLTRHIAWQLCDALAVCMIGFSSQLVTHYLSSMSIALVSLIVISSRKYVYIADFFGLLTLTARRTFS